MSVGVLVGERDRLFGLLVHDVLLPAAAGAVVLRVYDFGEDLAAAPVPADIAVQEVAVLAWRVQTFLKDGKNDTLVEPVCLESGDSPNLLTEVFPMPDGALEEPESARWPDLAAMRASMLERAAAYRRRQLRAAKTAVGQ